MNSLKQYISEKFQVSKNNIKTYTCTCHPKDKDELIDCIIDKIVEEGFGTEDKPLDLNDIDTSEVTDMSGLFDVLDGRLLKLSENGNFDISNWDVSNVKDMNNMFWGSGFDGDLSDWNVSKVENMNRMFEESKFTAKNGDISAWNVSNNITMHNAFYHSPLEKNPPKWYKR